MRIQTALLKGLLGCAGVVLTIVAWVGDARAQALLVEELPGGTTLVLVNQPLADATTLVWPEPTPDDPSNIGRLIAGRLTLATDVEAVFGFTEDKDEDEDDPAPAPQVVVAVGGVAGQELVSLLDRVLDRRPPGRMGGAEIPILVEGGLDRRLGAPGSDASLRLEVLLPPPGDWRRSSVEVLWEMLPQLFSASIPVLQSRIDGPVGILEGRVDAELAELTLGEIRLELARFASDPTLQADDVAEIRRRLQVRRHAVLEEHPDAALRVLERWRIGGEEAVREFIFGIQGVTLQSVRDAAAAWLPTHPGRAQLTLPPRVFNPRFAVGPETHRLSNDLTTAILERTGAPLAVVVLRPVMVPDLDGEVTATVLARMARQLRSAASRPGFVRVRTNPPLIEVAGPGDGFGELMEQLTSAYVEVISDQAPVTTAGDEGRRRALDLMAALVGITEGENPSPASLLRPGNLALGVVANDAEAAAEALRKFWASDATGPSSTDIRSVPSIARTRIAAPGDESVLVVALEQVFGGNEAISMVVRELLETRAANLWPESRVEVLAPYVPGRALLFFVLETAGTIDEVEKAAGSRWSSLTAAVGEEELAPVRRRVAAAASAEMSGVAGHARRCAATAAGASRWHQPAEFELEILTVAPEVVGTVLEGLSELGSLETTAAGALPIDDLQRR